MGKVDNWRSIVIQPQTPIIQVIQTIDAGALRVALVTDENDRLLGTVTDGDVRRGLLHHIDLNGPVTAIMNPRPQVARTSDSREHILTLMTKREIDHVPVVDGEGRTIGLETLQDLSRPIQRDNRVVIMAGGLGTRLAPLTDNCPKPMLPVGEKPILEVILDNFIEYGFHRFSISVNYKREMIQDHFGDGERWGVSIDYLEENSPLGTAGSLALLTKVDDLPFFVMNGDLLTRINFHRVLEFHSKHQAQATICVRGVEETLPFGVVQMDNHRLLGIDEKPVRRYFVNAGIYLLEPEVLKLIPGNGNRFDMPDLFRSIIEEGGNAASFPFIDYWLDIGRMGDFHRARQTYTEQFSH